MLNDADLEMIELAEQGNMIAAGVCPACEEALDPVAFFAANASERMPRGIATPAEYAAVVGPPSSRLGGYHEACAADILDGC